MKKVILLLIFFFFYNTPGVDGFLPTPCVPRYSGHEFKTIFLTESEGNTETITPESGPMYFTQYQESNTTDSRTFKVILPIKGSNQNTNLRIKAYRCGGSLRSTIFEDGKDASFIFYYRNTFDGELPNRIEKVIRVSENSILYDGKEVAFGDLRSAVDRKLQKEWILFFIRYDYYKDYAPFIIGAFLILVLLAILFISRKGRGKRKEVISQSLRR